MNIADPYGNELRQILANQVTILNLLHKQGKTMDAISTDIANLVSEVTGITADVTTVLQELAGAGNLTPDQQATLEAQITALGTVDAQLKAAIPAPAPTPAPPAGS